MVGAVRGAIAGLLGPSLLWFQSMVNYDRPWDYKTKLQGQAIPSAYTDPNDPYNGPPENFGNFHYGIAAAAMGVPEEFAKASAGAAQINHRSEPRELPYGDDKNDQKWIHLGYEWYRKCRHP